MVDREIANAQQGLPSGITLKLNNLVDKGLVNSLYAASSSGVPVNLLVRGMCSLIPNLEGISDNIRAISIVDRYLEHDRVYIFENGGDEKGLPFFRRLDDAQILIIVLKRRRRCQLPEAAGTGHHRHIVQRYGQSTLYR
ncbi:hypothetical protein ACVXHB_14580 [Escherichia coli]